MRVKMNRMLNGSSLRCLLTLKLVLDEKRRNGENLHIVHLSYNTKVLTVSRSCCVVDYDLTLNQYILS